MNYLQSEKSPFRRYAIIAVVIGVHLVGLAVLIGWRGHERARETLIRVNIFPAK